MGWSSVDSGNEHNCGIRELAGQLRVAGPGREVVERDDAGEAVAVDDHVQPADRVADHQLPGLLEPPISPSAVITGAEAWSATWSPNSRPSAMTDSARSRSVTKPTGRSYLGRFP